MSATELEQAVSALPAWWQADVALYLDQLSGGQFDDGKNLAYFGLLGGYPPDVVVAAVVATAALPRDWPIPPANEIHDRIVADTTVPTWPVAWRVICSCLHRHRENPRVAIAELEVDHPVLSRFVVEQGAKRLMNLKTEHEDWGGKVVKDLGDEYARTVERYAQLRSDKFVAGTAPQLGAVRERRGGPAKLGAAMQNLLGELTPQQQLERGST